MGNKKRETEKYKEVSSKSMCKPTPEVSSLQYQPGDSRLKQTIVTIVFM